MGAVHGVASVFVASFGRMARGSKADDSHLVLAESTWVLASVYDRLPGDIATAIEMFLNDRDLTIGCRAPMDGSVCHPPRGSRRCFALAQRSDWMASAR